MNRFFLFLLFRLLFSGIVSGQTPADTTMASLSDSTLPENIATQKDSLLVADTPDSVFQKPHQDSGWISKTGISFSSVEFNWQVLQHHPYFGFQKESVIPEIPERKQFSGKEWLFYLLIFLLVVFALIRRAFPKYFNNLFRLFFRTTLKQRQIREQLMQTPLPSLLLNGFFVVTGGLYITFLLQHFKLDPVHNFWLLFLYSGLGLSVAYFIKFIGLKVSGWLFNIPEAAESYTFIVFIVNKMIGILLLPFLVVLAFSLGDIYSAGLVLSGCLVAGLLIYRFILTFSAIRNQVKVNPFHFILYLCAFEIAPLLLVYKVLFQFFNQTA